MDDESFRNQVQTALAHLYDSSYLEAHPLAQALRGRIPSGDCGRALRRLIVDTIQDLKPQPGVDVDSASARNYECLYLRYVEPRPVVEIARGLFVSDRQERRRHHAAVETLCTVLWRKWAKLTDVSISADTGEILAADRVPAVELGSTALDTELDRIEMTRSSEIVDVREVIESAVATASRLAAIRGVRISSGQAHDRVLVVGNRVVLRQALIGVVVFAINSTDGDQVSLEIDSEPSDCVVAVRFVQRHAPVGSGITSDSAEGGLLESERLLRTQRGSLRLLSEGTRNTIVVGLSQQVRIRTVLVVDDSPELLELFRRYLSGSLYEPVNATTGDEALALARKLHPACIVLDVMMPSRDGWDILQSLRADPSTKSLPVIVCSVLRQRELALSLGASGSITKPVTQRTLLEALDRYSLSVA